MPAELRGQASDKPRGRKPRDVLGRVRIGDGLWGFEMVARPFDLTNQADLLDDDIAQMDRFEADGPDFSSQQIGKKRGFYATRQSVPVSALADEALAAGLGLRKALVLMVRLAAGVVRG